MRRDRSRGSKADRQRPERTGAYGCGRARLLTESVGERAVEAGVSAPEEQRARRVESPGRRRPTRRRPERR